MKNVQKEINSNVRYILLDEEGKFVHANSIRKISGGNYIYTTYDRPERAYTTIEAAKIALFNLELHNEKSNLGHSFKIEIMEVPEPKDYIIVDQDGRVADHYSISLTTGAEEKTTVWQYISWKSIVCGCFFYSTKQKAEQMLQGLNLIKALAGFNNLEFHIEECNGYDASDREAKDWILYRYLPVAKGEITRSRKTYRDYTKEYC